MYNNSDFDGAFDAQNAIIFSRDLAFAAAGGRAEFVMPVLHRQIGTDDLVLSGAQKVGFRPDRVEAYPGSRLFNAFGIVASGHQATTARQKILAGEEITAGDMREMFGGAGARAIVTHSASDALAIHHATGEPVLVAMTPDNMLLTAAYAAAITKDAGAVVLVPNGSPSSERTAALAAKSVGCRIADVHDLGGQSNLIHGLANAHRQADARTLDVHAVKNFIRDRILAPLDAARTVSAERTADRPAPARCIVGARLSGIGAER
jgi:hypothetical protein